jgi:pilus assembly protein FimV
MNNFKRVSAVVLAGMTLMLASGSSHGLGFGKPNSRSVLGDTLWLTVPLRLEAGEEIANECLAADVYFGDDKVAPSAVSAVVVAGNANERVLKVSTTALINEPVVTVYLAAGCKARITRKFVAFADPPGMAMPNVAESTPVDVAGAIDAATIPAQAVVSKPSALSAALQGKRQAAPVSAVRARAANGPNNPPSKVPGDQAAPSLSKAPSLALASDGVRRPEGKKAKAPRQSAAALAATGSVSAGEGSRLLLDPVEQEAMVAPSLRMAASLNAVPSADDATPDVLARRDTAAALWKAMNATPEQMVRDRQRLQDLEQRLAQLKQEGDRARQNIAELQTRVQQSQSAAGDGKWLTVVVAVALAAIALAAYLYLQLRQARKLGQDWWQSRSSEPSDTPEPSAHSESDLGHTTAEFVHVPSTPGSLGRVAPASSAMAQRAAAVEAVHQMVPDVAPAAVRVASPLQQARVQPSEPREVSVEELIDLEQQAEFFVVLGQDDAAIDLLEGHVQSTTGASPLPFLKLLEIYRRTGKRSEYERVQAEFNKRFNAHAPQWDSDFQHGHELVEYPGVIDRLQALWATPAKAMGVLEKSLTRPESGEDTFELPAYRELLFLYAVARDLSEREVNDRTTVDLLLPVMDADGDEPAGSVFDPQPLMATRPIKAEPEASPSMAMDLHLDDIGLPEPEAPYKP